MAMTDNIDLDGVFRVLTEVIRSMTTVIKNNTSPS